MSAAPRAVEHRTKVAAAMVARSIGLMSSYRVSAVALLIVASPGWNGYVPKFPFTTAKQRILCIEYRSFPVHCWLRPVLLLCLAFTQFRTPNRAMRPRFVAWNIAFAEAFKAKDVDKIMANYE